MSAHRPSQTGGSLLEVLVSMLICTAGVLGVSALQGRSAQSERESALRSKAAVLLEDMKSRFNANRSQAASYLHDGLIGSSGVPQDCSDTPNLASRDLCEWGNLLVGANEMISSERVGGLPQARGCISREPGTTDRYRITLMWAGALPSAGPVTSCAGIESVLPDERLRRAASTSVCIGNLVGNAPDDRC